MEPVATSSTELPGFEKVDLEDLSEETLTAEDLESSKKQLWLIKVPYEFDISKLNDNMVILNGTQQLPTRMVDKNSGKRYETRASKYTDGQSCPYEVVVPSRNENGLQVVKGFTGHLDIVQTVKVPMLVYPPTPPPLYTDVPKDLQVRWKPFGHRSPPFANSKSSDEKGDEEIQPNGGERKQKMKEKRYKESNAKEREEGSPKKKKKRKETDQPKVKTEEKHKKKMNNA